MENSTQIQFIQTYGQDGPIGIIDVDTAVQFPINFAVGDIKDPFAKKGVKSYKFSIVGSKETNQLLNHYYDINIVDGTYNNNLKQKVAILRNGVIILDNAYMQLLSIKKETHDVYSDQQITYDIEVGDDVTSFFTEITNKYLEDLDFKDMVHTYEASEVIASYSNSAIRDNVLLTGGYKYVLAWTPLTKYKLEECRPAISVYEYWNRIHQNAGYQWQWNGFNSDQIRMDKLWIPYNGEKPMSSDRNINLVAAENSAPLVFDNPLALGWNIPAEDFIIDTDVQDLSNLYNSTTGIYTSGIYTGASSIDATFEIEYTFEYDNPSASTAYLTTIGGLIAPGSWELTGSVYFKGLLFGLESGPAVFQNDVLDTNLATPYTLAPGLNTISSGTIQTATIPITWLTFTQQIKTKVKVNLLKSDPLINFRSSISSGTLIDVKPYLTITSIKMIIVPRADAYGYNSSVNLNDFVPRKIKQSDFIKSIANMYNLVIVPDAANDRKIVYKTRDDYYDGGEEKDWTDKLATDKGSEISFISNTNAKKITLSYKPDTDIVNKDYLAETKEVYGQQEYELQNENIKGLEQKEIIFSPTPIDNTSFGTYAPMYPGQEPKCNIRILIDGGEQPTGLGGTQTYDIVNYAYGPGGSIVDEITGINTYPMLTHQDNPNTPLFDINFGLCDKYYHDFTSVTNNNLYSMFWRRTIGQVDNGKLFTAYFYLNEYDISILKLNDKIFVKDTWYNINSLQYDPNSFGPTKVVLMTIDDELAIDIIKPRPTYPVLGTLTLAVLSEQIYNGLNWNYGDSSVVIRGTNNVVVSDIKNVIVVGNNRTVENSDTIYTENLVAENITLNGTDLQDVFNDVLINATISIPSADVLTLFTTPYLLIDSPGAGYFIQVLTASCKVDFNTTAYTVSTTLNIYTDTATRVQHTLNNALNASLSRIGVSSQQIISGAADTQLISDKAVYLKTQVGNPLLGDSDIVIYLSYKIIQE